MPWQLKRKTVTLLEVLISLGLTVGVLSAMLWCYQTVITVGYKSDQEQARVFQESIVHAKLAEVFPLAETELFKGTREQILITFDNGADLDKSFGGMVLGQLLRNNDGALVFIVMPSKERWQGEPPIKQQILLPKVDKLEFRYFTKTLGWQDQCSELPAIVEVCWGESASERQRFVLPYSKDEVEL